MAETAAWLVDRVIPQVPVRQWVLSFPIKIITRILRLLTREGFLVEEEGVTYVVDAHEVDDPKPARTPASRILHLPHRARAAGGTQSAELAIRSTAPMTQPLCANAHGFSLHAAVCCAAEQRSDLEHLCRYITRPASARSNRLRAMCATATRRRSAITASSACARR